MIEPRVVLPAQAGMILSISTLGLLLSSSTRASGDDPDAKEKIKKDLEFYPRKRG